VDSEEPLRWLGWGAPYARLMGGVPATSKCDYRSRVPLLLKAVSLCISISSLIRGRAVAHLARRSQGTSPLQDIKDNPQSA
jgi:hypothetical protein